MTSHVGMHSSRKDTYVPVQSRYLLTKIHELVITVTTVLLLM